MVKYKNKWGGSWTEEKLDAFEKYVNAYLTIMHSTRKKCNGWPKEIIYFDGFAGSGSKWKNEIEQSQELFQKKLEGLDIQQEEIEVYQGSCERVLSLEKKFDKYYFVDLDQDALNKLEKKLNEKSLINQNCFLKQGDVNNVISEFLEQWNNDKVALVLLDPYGMQVKWITIEKMKDKKIDLWILVPSGVVINRLLDKQGNLNHKEKLQECLGLSDEEIQKRFYQKNKTTNLFNEEIEIIEKKKDIIHKIAESYVEQLKKIFKHVTEKPLELKNSRNVTIYHFIFASNNKIAKDIAGQIIEKKGKRK